MYLTRSLAFFMHRVFLLAGIVALIALFSFQIFTAKSASPSFVRVIHASPFVGSADVFVDGTRLLSSFLFGSVTDYAAIPAGSHLVQIALVGKGVGAAAINQRLTVSPGVAYTVAAVGTSPTSLKLQAFIDNNILSTGTARVRMYHLAPDAGEVSLSTAGRTLLSGMTYEEASEYLSLLAGSHTFNVRASSADATLPVTTTMPANTVTSVFAIGLFEGQPKAELVVAQVKGIPGLPNTGSDPNALPKDTSTALIPWLLAACSLVFFALSFISHRFTVVQEG